jgi:5-methyltetrahydrofolate--homocysteine methyltransferase
VSDPYLAAVAERVVIFDGATGTNLQLCDLSADDFGGPSLEGCNEALVLHRPDVIADLHDSFLAVDVDVIETNTFGAFGLVLDEYQIADQAYVINKRAAEIAVEVAHGYSTDGRRRFVAGSIGPGTKMPSLGHVPFETLRDSYETQAWALLDGGVDLFIVETVYDMLQAKAAMQACRRAMASAGRHVPIQLQVTIETTGRMLLGTEIGAALTSLGAMRPDVFGLNCATGPREMNEHLRHLSQFCPIPLSCLPNAGLPSIVDGRTHYDLSPDELAAFHSRFISELGVRVVGGCCGTTTEHLAAVVAACRDLTPLDRSVEIDPGVASVYTHVPFQQENSVLLIGERTNANGSRAFRDAMLVQDWDSCEDIARNQVREGSHVLDLCVDYVGRDGAADMTQLASRFTTKITVPVVLDSTEPPVMEAGLVWLGGRAILNSANLEDGEGVGSRFDRVMTLARDYGAAVICLLIDEVGQARDVEWKMRVARRIYDLATTRYGIAPTDLLFDALTFPITTGDDDLRGDGMSTLEAITEIKRTLPGAQTVLGVSNVSFGLNPAAREVLNSMFLHEATAAGLDAAIVHAAKITPLAKIPEIQRQVCLDLIYDRRREGYDPLHALIELFVDVASTKQEVEDRSDWSIEKRLSHRIIDGDRKGLEVDLEEAMTAGLSPLSIVNDVLLVGMKTVGELFATGEMQLPFVLQSAETMKAAVAYLEPHMERLEGEDGTKGRIVLATVKGDVHDIGKNLVDIILTNNGYEVHNLGIKVGINEMIEKALEVNADAIGMSGLLVKSTLIMRDNLNELADRDLSTIPVILGGAALTRNYVEKDLRSIYPGRVFYGKDAFEGLSVMDRLVELRANIARDGDQADDPDFGRVGTTRNLPERASSERERLRSDVASGQLVLPKRSPSVASDNPVFVPPFIGSRVVKGIAIAEIAEWVNETALFRNQWGFRPDNGETDPEFKDRIRAVYREQLSLAQADDVLVPSVVYGYWPANADGDDVVVWSDTTRAREIARFPFTRQVVEPYLCIADFFRTIESGDTDYVSFHIVSMGQKVSVKTAELFAGDRYQDYLFLHGLGVELTEALAELWHARIRAEWGFGNEDASTVGALFRQDFRGGRYSWGYPACPDLTDNKTVAELLESTRIGVSVSEGFQLHPEQTTSAIICHHPQAKYFVV